MSVSKRLKSVSQPSEHERVGAGPIRVMLADDHPTALGRLRTLLEREEDLRVIAEATELGEIANRLGRVRPDVLVVDLDVLGGGLVKALRELRSELPAIQIVMLAEGDGPAATGRLLDGSVTCLVLKGLADNDLPAAVRHAAIGQQYVSAPVGDRLAALHSSATDGKLSAREVEILRLIAFGHTSLEIARKLRLSPRTIETHRAHIHNNLGLDTRASLVHYALSRGLLGV